MITYQSARGLTLEARVNALTPENQALYREAYKRVGMNAEHYTTRKGSLPKDVEEAFKDWALTAVETGQTLPALTPELYQATIDEYETAAQVRQLRNREAAARIIRQERTQDVPVPKVLALSELLEEPDEDSEFRIIGLLPTGARAVVSAQYKAGKSTLVSNVVKALVDDELFLDKFEVEPVERILLIDNELDPRTLKRWLRDQGIKQTHRVDVLSLRGRLSTFDILDPTVRAEWARRCEGVDMIIFDCLRPVLDALGLDESREAGRFLVAFDSFLAEASVPEAILVHHMGHSSERSRGDSRILDWPDVTWKLVREDSDDPSSARFFSAFGRDVDVQESALAYNHENRHLSLTGGSRRQASAMLAMPLLLERLELRPEGHSKNQLELGLKDSGLSRNDVRGAIKLAIEQGVAEEVPGERNAKIIRLIPQARQVRHDLASEQQKHLATSPIERRGEVNTNSEEPRPANWTHCTVCGDPLHPSLHDIGAHPTCN